MDVDLLKRRLSVEQAWDPCEGVIAPKSRAGKRAVPIPAALAEHLVAQRIRQAPDSDDEYVFARDGGKPFSPSTLHQRAQRAWKVAGVERCGLHEARHTFGTIMWDSMIEAGRPNPKRLQLLMGHADINTTMVRYVKDSLGSERQAAEDFDAYLWRCE
jgi:integrase